MSSKLTKVPGEKYLYIGPRGVYYLRQRTETEDTEVSLETTKIRKAGELRDKWVRGQHATVIPLDGRRASVELGLGGGLAINKHLGEAAVGTEFVNERDVAAGRFPSGSCTNGVREAPSAIRTTRPGSALPRCGKMATNPQSPTRPRCRRGGSSRW